MTRQVHIACLQTRPQPEFSQALAEAIELADNAIQSGAEFLFLPEYCGGLKAQHGTLCPPTECEDDHPVLNRLRVLADQNSVWILVGSLAIKAPNSKIINRSFTIDSNGKICSRYDKIHLFDVELSENESYRESASVAPGSNAVVTSTPWGALGHTICYDLRFPQLYRNLAKSGAELLAVPAAFTRLTGQAHWHVLNRARAIENGAVVVAPCTTGAVPGGGDTYGHSLIINPWGEILADGGDGRRVVSAIIDLDDVSAARAMIPSLEHDRPFQISAGVKRNAA